jgi:hypothetical protein
MRSQGWIQMYRSINFSEYSSSTSSITRISPVSRGQIFEKITIAAKSFVSVASRLQMPGQCHASMLPKHLEPNIHHSTMIDSPPSLSSTFTSQPVSMSVDEHTSHLKTYYHNTFPLALTCMDVNDQKLFPIFLSSFPFLFF